MKHICPALVLLLTSALPAAADGFDFSGTVSMGLAGSNTNGETRIEPIARTQGTISYTIETDGGLRLTLAYDFDETLVLSGADDDFLPGHR